MIPLPEKLVLEAAKRAQQRLTEHIERFAAAYIKLTDIPPNEAVMMHKIKDDGTQMIWFERKEPPAKPFEYTSLEGPIHSLVDD